MKFRKVILWILSVLLLLGLTGCGTTMENAVGSGTAGDFIVKEENTLDAESTVGLPENRKLIQTVDMRVETENLDTVLQQIDSRIAQLGGYIESSNVQNGSAYSGQRYRSATITIRIPAKDLESFIDKVGQITNVVSSQKKVQDVTLNYVATESRMKALQAEETRLLELMTKAETLDDLLTVEKRLTDVRTELEKVTSTLKVFDNQVDYATIHLSIEEVKEYTDVSEPDNIWDRISKGFEENLEGVGDFFVELFVTVVVSIPYITLIGVFFLAIVLLVRLKKRKKNKKFVKEDPKENP